MVNKRLIPIFDLYENIYDVNNSKYPYTEGQILYATDINKVFKDKGGVRISDIQYYFIDVEDSGDIDDVQLLDQYKTNFLILRGKDKSQKTFFIDENGKAREFESDSLFVIDQVNFYAISAYDKLEKTEIGGKKVYYLLDVDSGEWSSEDIPFKDEKPYKWKKTITTYKNGDVTEEIILVGRMGKEGKPGPGIVFRGEWKPNVSYIGNSVRKDVVEYQKSFYYAKEKDSNIGQEPSSQSDYWESFGENFSSVATGLLLTNESYVKSTINVGTNTTGNSNITIFGENNYPYLSIGQDSKTFNSKGIFLGMVDSGTTTPKFSLVSQTATNKLAWDGENLEVVGDIGGQIGSIEIGTPNANGSEKNGILIDSTGIQAFKDANQTFKIGADGNAKFSGEIDAQKGYIGGFTISKYELYNDTSDEPKPGTMNSIWLSGVGKDSNLSIANSNPKGQTITRSWLLTASKNFGVDKNGIVYAADAKISGEISNTSEMYYDRYSVIPRKHITLWKNNQTNNYPIVYYDNTKWKIKTIISEKGITTSLYSGTDSRNSYSYESGNGSPEIYFGDFNILTTMNASTNVHTITSSPQPIILGSSAVSGDGVYTGLGIYSNDYLSLTMKEKNIIGSRSYYFDSSMKKILDEKIEIGDGDWERVEVSSGKDIHFYPYRKVYLGHSTILSEQYAVTVTSLPSLQHYYSNGVKENWLNADGSSSRQQLFMLCGTTASIPANSWVTIETLTNVRVLSVVANTYRANDSSLSNVEGGCQVYWSRTLDANNIVTTVYIGSDVTYETRVSWMIIGYRSLDKYAPGQ